MNIHLIKKTTNIIYYLFVPSWIQTTYSVIEYSYSMYQWKEQSIKKIIMNNFGK